MSRQKLDSSQFQFVQDYLTKDESLGVLQAEQMYLSVNEFDLAINMHPTDFTRAQCFRAP